MGLITKLAWVALPALAGCGMLSQVSSQGSGTNPGGKVRQIKDVAWSTKAIRERAKGRPITAMIEVASSGSGSIIGFGEIALANIGSDERAARISYIKEAELSPIAPVVTDNVLSRLNIRPQFANRSDTLQKIAALGLTPYNFLGVTESDRKRLVDAICVRFYRGELKFVPGMSVDEIGKGIRAIVDETMIEKGFTNVTRRFHQYLCAEAVCAWSISNVFFGGAPSNTNIEHILAHPGGPRAECAGKAVLVRALAKACAGDIGLRCSYYAGWYRYPQQITDKIWDSNHAWNLFTLDGEISIPADVLDIEKTNSLAKARSTNEKVGDLHILPIKPSTVEYFMACRFGIKKQAGEENRFVDPNDIVEYLGGYRLLPWVQVNASYVAPLESVYPFVR